MTTLRVLIMTLLLTASTSATATNGYFTHGTGARNKGAAGAGGASPATAIDIANNPASAALVGERFDFGLSLFSPRRSYTTSTSLANGEGGAFTVGPDAVDSAREGFVIPYLARTWQFGDHAFGIAFYGRGGMNTAWQGGTASFDPDGPGPAPVSTFEGTFGSGAAGVDLSQAFLDLAYARSVSDSLHWGAALVLAAQRFEATGVGSFAPFTRSFASSGGAESPSRLSDNGHDVSYGGGVRVGFNARLHPAVRIAAAYQSRIYMNKFDDYADLFAGRGDFDIPSSLRAGLSLQVNPAVALFVDFERTWFSEVDAVGNPISYIFDCPTAGRGGTDVEACLGGERGAGFGWDDVDVVKLGAEWRHNERWTWRAGASFAGQPIAPSEVTFNILAPGVIEQHYTLGFTRKVGRNGELNLALMYAPEETVSGPNTFDPTQTIELRMRQFELELGYSWSRGVRPR